ncbi:2381_t:CDS:1, partial [Ambispora leptoticha]
ERSKNKETIKNLQNEVILLKAESAQLEIEKLTIELNKKDILYQILNRNLENERSKSKETIENLQNEVISLKAESTQLESEIEKFNEEYKKLTIEINNKDTFYQILNRESERLKNKETIENLQNEVISLKAESAKLESEIEKFNQKYKKLTIEINKKDTLYQNWESERLKNKETIENLQSEVVFLKAESAQFQPALGGAKNVRWDEDVNNSVNFNKDIKELQNSLCEFTQLKVKAYIVKESGVKQLFNKYNSKANIEHKPSISAALQRLTIETILNDYAKYINTRSSTKSNAEDNSLERQLLIYNETITKIIENFAETRAKNDEMVRITGIKIRQAVYAMLGNSGFGKKNHRFFAAAKYNLLNTLTYCRTIVPYEKRKEQEERAGDIILSVTRIFMFRLLAHEPIATIRWFENGDQLNENLMEWVSNGEDVSDMVVDICAFPAIGVNLEDPEKRQIYIKAKVVICNKLDLIGQLLYTYSKMVKKSIF